MRLIKVLMMSIFMLSACSEIVPQPKEDTSSRSEEQVDKDKDEDVKTEEPIEMTEEEKLIRQIPENASLSDWNLILVNPWQALPEDYEVDMVEVDNQQRIDSRIVDAWETWKQAAQEDGHRLFFASGFRTVERQANNFNNKIQGYLNEGLSEDEALEKAKEYLTEPGHSEHHTGLALDIVDEEWIVAGHGLEPEYDTQDSQQWLVTTMADNGFVLRYPEGKETITGIQYESWHFRYVGVENAQFMIENELVLEEYIDLIKLRDETE